MGVVMGIIFDKESDEIEELAEKYGVDLGE